MENDYKLVVLTFVNVLKLIFENFYRVEICIVGIFGKVLNGLP